jgi:hypothetical protein
MQFDLARGVNISKEKIDQAFKALNDKYDNSKP